MTTKKHTTTLPTTFNSNYFFKIIRIILECDHYQSINRLLIILYSYFDYLNPTVKYQLTMYLMGRAFFKLYFHWNYNIRHIFYLFLEVKIKFIKHQKSVDIGRQYAKVKKIVKVIERIHRDNQHQKKMEN